MTASSLNEAQHDGRRRNIGGSDVAALLGLSKWKSPVDLWLEKTGRAAPDDISGNPAVQAGIRMESAILNWFVDETGIEVTTTDVIHKHPEYERLVANPDGLALPIDAGVEVKTSSAWMQQDWGPYEYGSQDYGSDVPLPYVCQCLHYMSVFDVSKWYLAALIGGNDFRVYLLERDREFEKELIRRELEFIAHLDNDVPPEPTSVADVVRLHPSSAVEEILADSSIEPWLNKVSEADRNAKGWVAKKEEAKTRIADYMGDAGRLVGTDGATLVNFKDQTTTRLDTTRLKKERPEIYSEYAKVSTTRPMRLNI